jgi:hypothetical protein
MHISYIVWNITKGVTEEKAPLSVHCTKTAPLSLSLSLSTLFLLLSGSWEGRESERVQ